MSRCKSCNAEIIWIKTKTGKSMPCNPKPIQFRPDPDGEMNLVESDGTVIKGTMDTASQRVGYISHFATCPNSNRHRRQSRWKR